MSFLSRSNVTAQNVGFAIIDWLEGWLMDVKKPPDSEVLEELKSADKAKPKRSMKLYRGLNQGEFKSVKIMMKKKFGKELEVGDTIELKSTELTSWSKTANGAANFAYCIWSGGRITKRTQGIIFEANVAASNILLDVTKVTGLDSHLKSTIKAEQEVIVQPATITATVLYIRTEAKPMQRTIHDF